MASIINLARYRQHILAQREKASASVPRYYASPHERELYESMSAYRMVYGFSHGRLDAPLPVERG
jgi:hypothetical protein